MARYQLKRSIATGGMGEVFEAVSVSDGRFTRKVAVKRMLPEALVSPDAAQSFIDEARIVSQLHHANIVSILDFGMADGLPFQVLEFVDGTNAAQLLRLAGGRMPAPVALHICTEIAHALEHAHQARDGNGAPLGVIHRDVNPNNILISWDGDVKLTDFGIAFARNREGRTLAGTTKGTPAFMAPEQYMGSGADRRTDLFALGCVLHCLLLGESPLAPEGRVAAVVAGQRLPLSSELPDDVRAVLERALAPVKAQRFDSAGALAAELGRALRQRLQGDARSQFKSWLLPLSPRAAPAGGFDALLAAAAGNPVAVTELTGMVTGPISPTDPDRSPRRAWRWPVLAAGAGLALGGGAWLWTQIRTPPPPPLMPVVVEAPPSPPPPPAPPPLATAPAYPPAAVHYAPIRHPAPVGMGVLAIGGEGALRAEIVVDGQSRGFAPKTLELPAGPHRCELMTADGRHLGPRTLELTARNTASEPLRWMVP